MSVTFPTKTDDDKGLYAGKAYGELEISIFPAADIKRIADALERIATALEKRGSDVTMNLPLAEETERGQ